MNARDEGGAIPGRLRISTRDPEVLRAGLVGWLERELGAGARPSVQLRGSPSATGMSSETILFDAQWHEGDSEFGGEFVLRLAPPDDAFPIFPRYDLAVQAAAMRLVAERSRVPVPAVRWLEPASAPLGAPFFVMARVDGVAAPDVMPYVFGSWLSEASPADQAKVQQRSVEILCGIHAVEATDAELAFLELDQPGATPLRRHVAGQKSFYEWARRGRRFPVVESLFHWLDESWPERESGSLLCWGDARIGNVLWRDFAPVAVLDWECAAVAPREFDLGWLIFFHRYFQDYAEQANVPGMPGFLRRDDVAQAYAAASGHEPRNLDWYLAYAALRQALVSIRTSDRQIHFGERPAPEDPEELIQQCAMLERILDGAQEWK